MQKYFDALTSAYFKTTHDGRHLFCPWGIWGTCYAIASEQDYERLRQQLKYFTIATIVLIGGASGAFQSYVPAIVVSLLIVAFYLIWVRFLLRSLQPSTERLTFTEATTTQARTHSASTLWLMEIVSVVFVVSGVLILIYDPASWHIGLLAISFFGLAAAFVTYLLVVRNRRAVL
jgi:hypothetical protein